MSGWDLAQQYFTECLGLPDYILSGCGLVNNMLKPPKLDVMLQYFDEVSKFDMQPGDVCIWEYGHIAIFDYYDGTCYYFSQNYPLNSGKGSLYEGGIREPMIVCWPGVTKVNSRCNEYIMIEDFYPTILEMAGIDKYHTIQPIDGVSFVPLLTTHGNPSKGRALIWNFPNIWGNNGPGINLNCAIREDEWKLIYYYETGEKELFNIYTDIYEKENLILVYPNIVKRLSAKLGHLLREMNAQRPVFRESNLPCPWPDEI